MPGHAAFLVSSVGKVALFFPVPLNQEFVQLTMEDGSREILSDSHGLHLTAGLLIFLAFSDVQLMGVQYR